MILNLKPKVQKQIIKEYEMVRESGETNMLDWYTVRLIAQKKSFKALAAYIRTYGEKGWSALLSEYANLLEKYL